MVLFKGHSNIQLRNRENKEEREKQKWLQKKKEKKRKKVICLSSFSQNAQLYILERKKKKVKNKC